MKQPNKRTCAITRNIHTHKLKVNIVKGVGLPDFQAATKGSKNKTQTNTYKILFTKITSKQMKHTSLLMGRGVTISKGGAWARA